MPRHASPLSPDDGPLAVFALELRALRDSRGPTAPTPDEISDKESIHRGTIYAALQGKRVPTRDVLSAIVHAWGGNQAEWMAKRTALENALAIARQVRQQAHAASEPRRRTGTTWGELQQSGVTWGDLSGEPETQDSDAQRRRVQDFAQDLRQLHTEHGAPTLHELSRRIEKRGMRRVGKATLSDLLRGNRKRMPALELVMEVVVAITGDREDAEKWKAKWVEAQRP